MTWLAIYRSLYVYIDVIIRKIKQYRHRSFNVETINAQHEYFCGKTEALMSVPLQFRQVVKTGSEAFLRRFFQFCIRITLKNMKPPAEQMGIHRLRTFIDEFSAKNGMPVPFTHQGDLDTALKGILMPKISEREI